MKNKWVKAWHFMADKGGKPVLRDGSEAPAVRKILKHDGEIKICESGLHASERIIDALRYAPGPWCALVEVRGIEGRDSDKLVARERRILKIINSEKVLWRFACDVACKVMEDASITDERSWTALTARQGHMVGMVTDEDMAAARDAARDAALAAACAAARDAAWAAACAAARAAARDAARDAALAAACAAARDAARDAQNSHLESLMKSAFESEE